MPEIQLSQGTVRYRDGGAGPPVLFVHGVLVDGRAWGRVVPRLTDRARCIVPDLPLGAHQVPMPTDADLSPLGLARLIVELIERLELDDVTLVGNDTGGALCQLVAAHHPQRLARLVLTNCDSFEHFPPKQFRLAFRALTAVPGSVASLATLGRLRSARTATMRIAPLTVMPFPDELLKAWVAPLRQRAIRRDLIRVLSGISPTYTLEAVEHLRHFNRPVLIVWGMRDSFFPISDAERLAEVLPNARIERVQDARTFVQLDAPERVADLIGAFAAAQVAGSRSA